MWKKLIYLLLLHTILLKSQNCPNFYCITMNATCITVKNRSCIHLTCPFQKNSSRKCNLLYTMANANIPPVLVPMIQSNKSTILLLVIFSMVINISIKIKPLIPPPSKHNTRSPFASRPTCNCCWSEKTAKGRETFTL